MSQQEYPDCECCGDMILDEQSYGGSCSPDCPHHVEHMCSGCVAWNKDQTQLLCPDCKKSEDEDAEPVYTCQVCGDKEVDEDHYVGCCSDGDCPHHIEFLCKCCGTWDSDKGQWLCDKCVS